MNNGTYAGATACPDSIGGQEHRDVWNGQLFAKQVMPFVDMTVKGFLWCACCLLRCWVACFRIAGWFWCGLLTR